MKLSCEIVQDLLPLYADDACSEESRQAVEEHLEQCPDCRGYLERMTRPDVLPVREPERSRQEKAVKNSFRKVRRRWIASVLAVLMLLPASLLVLMGVNEYRGEGLAYTNLDDICMSYLFVKLLENGRYETAAGMIDYERDYQSIQKVLAKKPEEYMPSVEVCTIDGARYAVFTEHFERLQLQESYEGEEVLDLWMIDLLQWHQVMVPEEYWLQIVSRLPEEDLAYLLPEGCQPLETPWGRFYINFSDDLKQNLEQIEGGEAGLAMLLCELSCLVPYEIFEASLPAREDYGLKSYQWYQKRFEKVADMTQEEYVRYMEGEFVRGMEECAAQGASLHWGHFSDAYICSDQERKWSVEIRVEERHADGDSFWIRYDLITEDGKIRLGATTGPGRTRSLYQDGVWFRYADIPWSQ